MKKTVNMKYKLLFLLVLLCITSALYPQSILPELIGDRPDMTESAYTVPKGFFQFETGVDFTYLSDKNTETSFNSSLLRYGISKNAELRLGIDVMQNKVQDIQTFSVPFYLGTKIHLLKKDKLIPEMALIIASSGQKTDHTFDFTPGIIGTCEFNLSQIISLGINVGAEYSTLDENSTGIVSAALGIGIGEDIGIFLESAWFPSNLSNDARFNAGITYLVSKGFQLDLYSGFGLLSDSPVCNAGAGIILLF